MTDTPKTCDATRAHVIAIVEQLQQLGSAGAGAIDILSQGLTSADDTERLDAIAEALGGLATVLSDLQRATMRARAEIAELTPGEVEAAPGGAVVELPRGAS